VLLAFRFSGFYVCVGPQFGYAISGKYKTEYDEVDALRKGAGMRQIDPLMVNGNLAVWYPLVASHILVGASYSTGLTDIAAHNNVTMRHSEVVLRAGYYFRP
jgi:hypothetical protein